MDSPTTITERTLLCRAESGHFGRKLSLDRFSLDDDLLSQSSDDSQNDSSFLSLPYEVQIMVYQNVRHAPSQVSLALTCKTMACVARDVNLHRTYVSPKYAGSLPKEVFDVPCLMRQLSSWMPNTLQLCDHCLTARPLCPKYWASVVSCEDNELVRGEEVRKGVWKEQIGWDFAKGSWHRQRYNICPACQAKCTPSDYTDCDGCRALGRLGHIDWDRVGFMQRDRRRLEPVQTV